MNFLNLFKHVIEGRRQDQFRDWLRDQKDLDRDGFEKLPIQSQQSLMKEFEESEYADKNEAEDPQIAAREKERLEIKKKHDALDPLKPAPVVKDVEEAKEGMSAHFDTKEEADKQVEEWKKKYPKAEYKVYKTDFQWRAKMEECVNERKVTAAELKQILGQDGWDMLFKDGNPSGYVTHKIKGFGVEWHPDTAEWILSEAKVKEDRFSPEISNMCAHCGKEGTKFASNNDEYEYCSKECADKGPKMYESEINEGTMKINLSDFINGSIKQLANYDNREILSVKGGTSFNEMGDISYYVKFKSKGGNIRTDHTPVHAGDYIQRQFNLKDGDYKFIKFDPKTGDAVIKILQESKVNEADITTEEEAYRIIRRHQPDGLSVSRQKNGGYRTNDDEELTGKQLIAWARRLSREGYFESVNEDTVNGDFEFETEDGNKYTAEIEVSTSRGMYGSDADGRRGVMSTFIDDVNYTIYDEQGNEVKEPTPEMLKIVDEYIDNDMDLSESLASDVASTKFRTKVEDDKGRIWYISVAGDHGPVIFYNPKDPASKMGNALKVRMRDGSDEMIKGLRLSSPSTFRSVFGAKADQYLKSEYEKGPRESNSFDGLVDALNSVPLAEDEEDEDEVKVKIKGPADKVKDILQGEEHCEEAKSDDGYKIVNADLPKKKRVEDDLTNAYCPSCDKPVHTEHGKSKCKTCGSTVESRINEDDASAGKLYLVRHAKTALNSDTPDDKDKIRGWKDIPLDDTGKQQAVELAQQFAGVKVDKIYSSDLTRCKETADEIAKVVDAPIEATEELRPWHLGKYEGQESSKITDELRDFVENKPDEPVDGGESFNTFKTRYLSTLRRIADEVKAGQNIMIVTHYRDVKMTQAWLKAGGKDDSIDVNEFMDNSIETGCSFEIKPEDEGWKIEKFATPETTHPEVHKVEAGTSEAVKMKGGKRGRSRSSGPSQTAGKGKHVLKQGNTEVITQPVFVFHSAHHKMEETTGNSYHSLATYMNQVPLVNEIKYAPAGTQVSRRHDNVMGHIVNLITTKGGKQYQVSWDDGSSGMYDVDDESSIRMEESKVDERKQRCPYCDWVNDYEYDVRCKGCGRNLPMEESKVDEGAEQRYKKYCDEYDYLKTLNKSAKNYPKEPKMSFEEFKKKEEASGRAYESKVNEDEVTNEPADAAEAGEPAEPKIEAPTADEPTEQPEPEDNAEPSKDAKVENKKEYLGNDGDDMYYSLLSSGDEGGKPTQLQVVDANDQVVYPKEGQEAKSSDVAQFIVDALQSLNISNVSYDIVMKYILPPAEEEAEQKEKEEAPKTPQEPEPHEDQHSETAADQSAREQEKEETMSYEAVARLIQKYALYEKDLPASLLEKYGLIEGVEEENPMPETIDMSERLKIKYGLLEDEILREANLLLEKYKLYEAPEDEEPKLTPADEPKEEEPKLTPAEEPEKAKEETPEVKGEPKAETPEPAAAEEPATSGREVTPLETPSEAPATDDPEKVAEFTREQIKQDYPEEPYTSTALAFADSFVHDPQVYGRIRSLQWSGLYTDSDTFLKQAKIVATFNNFTPEMAKLLVDKFGESAKYKLSRDGGVYAYITVRDTSRQHSLEAVKDLVNANVVKQTGNPGEVEIQWE